jgi:hypothetical protein
VVRGVRIAIEAGTVARREERETEWCRRGVYQQGDGVVADHDPRGKPQLGGHPKSAIGPAESWCTLTRSVSQAWRIARPEGGRSPLRNLASWLSENGGSSLSELAKLQVGSSPE